MDGSGGGQSAALALDYCGYRVIAKRYGLKLLDLEQGRFDKIKVHPLNKPSKDEKYTTPPRYTSRFPCPISADGVCCTCMGNLMFALGRLSDERMLSSRFYFLIGQMAESTDNQGAVTIAVGRCAVKQHNADVSINKCPPSANEIFQEVETVFESGNME